MRPQRFVRSWSASSGAKRDSQSRMVSCVTALSPLEQQLRDVSEAELVPQPPEHGQEDDVPSGTGRSLNPVPVRFVEEAPAGATGECPIAERSATPAAAGLVGVAARGTSRAILSTSLVSPNGSSAQLSEF